VAWLDAASRFCSLVSMSITLQSRLVIRHGSLWRGYLYVLVHVDGRGAPVFGSIGPSEGASSLT